MNSNLFFSNFVLKSNLILIQSQKCSVSKCKLLQTFEPKFSNFCKISWKHFEHLSNKIWIKTTQVVFFSIGLFQTTHFKNTLESFSKCFRIKWFKSVFRITLWRVTEYILLFLKFSSKQSGFSNLISLSTFWSFRNKILSNFLWISVFKLKPWVKQFKSNCFLLNEQKSLPNWNQNFWNVSNIVFSNSFSIF